MNDDHHAPPGAPQQPQTWNAPQNHPGAAPQPQHGSAHAGAPQQPHTWNAPQNHPGGAAPHPQAPNAQPGPHGGHPQQPALHQNVQAAHMTGLGAATGQAYLAMFTKQPLPKPRLVGLGMMSMACLVAMAQLAMITLRGVYTWEGMLLLFCSGVPGAWLAVMGDPPDPSTGLVSTQRRAGLIASFVVGLVLAFATSTFLVWVVGIEHW